MNPLSIATTATLAKIRIDEDYPENTYALSHAWVDVLAGEKVLLYTDKDANEVQIKYDKDDEFVDYI